MRGYPAIGNLRCAFIRPGVLIKDSRAGLKRKHKRIMDKRVIAIDGPAGSGKSTAARRLAEALGFTHLNTGAMYRAVAFLATEGGIDLEDEKKRPVIANIARKMEFEYRIVNTRQHFIVNGADHTEELFRATLTAQLKPVVNNLDVREALVQKMRSAVERFLASGAKGVVMEGRD